jgi:hypothetical protein
MTPSEIDRDAFRTFELAGWAAIGDTYGCHYERDPT